MSEIPSEKEMGMSEPVSSSPTQLNRRELGKLALAGALGATALDWPRSGFAQEQNSSAGARSMSPGNQRGIKLACTCPSNATDNDLLFYKQMGVDVVHVNMQTSDSKDPVEGMRSVKKRFADAGLMIGSSGGAGVDSNSSWIDIVLNRVGRDKAIEAYKTGIRLLSRAGFNYLQPMFDVAGPVRSGVVESRGSQVPDCDLSSSELSAHFLEGVKGSAKALLFGREFTREEIWENWTYFIKQVAPVAEEAGVLLGFHPNDPPTPSLFGVPHIFANFEDYKKALEIANSPNVGVCLCCGTWAEGGAAMGVDPAGAVRYFGSRKQIFEIHFRSVSATLPHFYETYPDEGYYDMYQVMKALVDVKYAGNVLLDHTVPTVGGLHTYEAFGISYMRALLQRAQREANA
jgi:mannonate dehydratase